MCISHLIIVLHTLLFDFWSSFYGSKTRIPCITQPFPIEFEILKPVSVMDTDIVINSEQIKVGNGHWKSVLRNFRIFVGDPGSSEGLSPYIPMPNARGGPRGQKGMIHSGFLKDCKFCFTRREPFWLPSPTFPPTIPLATRSLPS